jgi:hypothetical protein
MLAVCGRSPLKQSASYIEKQCIVEKVGKETKERPLDLPPGLTA